MAPSPLLQLLNSCPTSWHAVRLLKEQLQAAGFAQLDEALAWNLIPGERYFLPIGPGALLAFVAQTQAESLTVLGSHTESPMLRLKDMGLSQEEGYWVAYVEPYGSPILPSWFFKDLGLAGRLLLSSEQGVREELVQVDRPVGILLSPPIHLERELNQKGLAPDKQRHLKVLLGHACQEDPLQRWLANQGELLAHELFFYPLDKAAPLAFDEEWINSWRIDNLASCAASVEALLSHRSSKEVLAMALFADHEEVGSQTSAGAASPRYRELIGRVLEALGYNDLQQRGLMQRGWICSVDGAHGFHPAYSELYEPRHRPKLGCGPVLKHSSQARYATDARSAARLRWHAQHAQVLLQSFHIRADLPSGSTIGPILSTLLGMEAVDLGLAQLAMHASREAMHIRDYEQLVRLLVDCLERRCQLWEEP